MRTVSRLRLLLCLIYGHRLPSAITPTLCPVETMQAHQKYNPVSYVSICYGHIDYTFGGPGGIRTPVQNTFLDNSLRCSLQYIFIWIVCQPSCWPNHTIDFYPNFGPRVQSCWASASMFGIFPDVDHHTCSTDSLVQLDSWP